MDIITASEVIRRLHGPWTEEELEMRAAKLRELQKILAPFFEPMFDRVIEILNDPSVTINDQPIQPSEESS